MKACDEVISLGYNCEISFRIRDYYGQLCSYPFSWAYILDREAFLVALDNLDEIFQGEVNICNDPRVNTMIECSKYHICFHPRGEFVAEDGSIKEECFQEAVMELRQRVAYLVKKFRENMNDSTKEYIFFVGLTDNGKSDDRDFMIRLKEKIDKLCPAQNYQLVGVVSQKRYRTELGSLNGTHIQIRKIKRFGRQKCNDISTDSIGWGKIFGEFLGKEQLYQYYWRLQSHRIERIIMAVRKRVKFLLELFPKVKEF